MFGRRNGPPPGCQLRPVLYIDSRWLCRLPFSAEKGSLALTDCPWLCAQNSFSATRAVADPSACAHADSAAQSSPGAGCYGKGPLRGRAARGPGDPGHVSREAACIPKLLLAPGALLRAPGEGHSELPARPQQPPHAAAPPTAGPVSAAAQSRRRTRLAPSLPLVAPRGPAPSARGLRGCPPLPRVAPIPRALHLLQLLPVAPFLITGRLPSTELSVPTGLPAAARCGGGWPWPSAAR